MILFTGLVFSQSETLELNPAAGDVYNGSDFTLSWSIGEGVIETFSNNEIVLTQGFHQPSLKVTLIDEAEDINFHFDVYPNPTRDFVTISYSAEEEINCSTQLFDMSGKLIYSKALKGKELTEHIDLTKYSSNIYILRIVDTNGKLVKSYKVQKIK